MSQLNVVLYWHMHQPEYRDLRNGEYLLPWTYLHTIKDYVDMVAHLENNPKMKAVVNFAPVLLEQIDDYAKQLKQYFSDKTDLSDPLLRALADPSQGLNIDQKRYLVKACKRANKTHLIDRYPAFAKLDSMSELALDDEQLLEYYSEQFFADLVVWYHLAWTAETVRVGDERIQLMMEQAHNFTEEYRLYLLKVYKKLISGVIGRYKKLAQRGQIELSFTPYAHPIVPLLLDINSTHQAMPGVSLPQQTEYPDGKARSFWHLKKGMQVFEHYFGFKPKGCWPSEGSISEATLALMDEVGLDWVASGETVLRNSLVKNDQIMDEGLLKAYCLENEQKIKTRCFFRDDGLSDLIGFKYSNWHADDAVANLISHLDGIAQNCKEQDNAIISIILDGENAWEYYPFNGFYFLDALYKKLSSNQHIKVTTYSEYLQQCSDYQPLKAIVAGSWVYGTFSTWIGEKDKNRAWDMLVDAKKVYDQVMLSKKLKASELKAAEMQLATCESSDWFWWFGEYNSAESVSSFDLQFRLHLKNLYKLLKQPPPAYLEQAFSFGSGDPVMGGAMLPGKQ